MQKADREEGRERVPCVSKREKIKGESERYKGVGGEVEGGEHYLVTTNNYIFYHTHTQTQTHNN